MNWFRFYGDALRDAKLRKAARLSGQPFAQVLGIWAVILCYANDSPTRGALWIAPGVPVTEDDIAEVAGCNVSETLRLFQDLSMILVDNDGALVVVNWKSRQYASDSSTERVKEHRERQKQAPKPPELPKTSSETLPQQGNATLPQRCGNAPDTDTDTDTELKDEDDAGAQAVKGAIRAYENQIGLLSGAHQAGEMTAIISELHERGTLTWWNTALKIACDNNARKWSYVRAILENSLKTGIAPGTKPPAAERRNGNGTSKPRVDPAVVARQRKADDEYDNAAALARI